jgi:hypothetical protein
LVFNKTADLLVATNAANFKTQATVLEALGIEAVALSRSYVYPILVSALEKSISASK